MMVVAHFPLWGSEDHEGPIPHQRKHHSEKQNSGYYWPRCKSWVYHKKLCASGCPPGLSGLLPMLAELTVSLLVCGWMGPVRPLKLASSFIKLSLYSSYPVALEYKGHLLNPFPVPLILSDLFTGEGKQGQHCPWGRTFLYLTWQRTSKGERRESVKQSADNTSPIPTPVSWACMGLSGPSVLVFGQVLTEGTGQLGSWIRKNFRHRASCPSTPKPDQDSRLSR